MNIRHIRRAVGLVAKSSVSELHFEDALGMTLIVRNQPQPKPVGRARVAMQIDAAASSAARTPPQPAVSAPSRIIVSPMVGRFYRSARRDGAPLIRVGDPVEAGQAVGSVEMMRLMYSIRSDWAGTIEEVLVDDGDAIEYGQPLVRIT